ncbi:pyridoxal 5'-phosphate synthase glutaminase subunit PdxT [Candidatus Micrarchaeota archaeon]|nr:pyridoxal 5'-phosphate synthase glutaminase subunit PdxT [Candidatus Micrarchaeota archaeon]
MKVGVIAFQGAVSEHMQMIDSLLGKGSGVAVRSAEELERVSAVIIPGGESTTIGKLMRSSGVFRKLKELGDSSFPIWGTCAGMIMLAREGDAQVERTGELLGLMDMRVKRNAFGRQRESFEEELEVAGIGRCHCVFIRAPAVERIYGRCRALAHFGRYIVAAEQGNLLATAFHPELSGDSRFHRYFISKVDKSIFLNR